MKKALAVLLLIRAGICLAENESVGRAITRRAEASATTSSTNYYGSAVTTAGSTVSTNDASWAIVKIVVDANGTATSTQNAYGSGNNPLWSNAWSNKASATYK
jgi:hypothetical protein|tara:strand:- start:4597 stop:4905 length:309 start_codon:yes stop_codon:yes gene_type:complete